MQSYQKAETEFFSKGWEHLLDELVGTAREHLILVAPFIKKHPLQRISKLLSGLPFDSQPKITILTNMNRKSLLDNTLEISSLVKFVDEVQTVCVKSLSTLHAKIYLADKSKAIVTSANLTLSGLLSSTEYGVIIRDPDMVNHVYQDVTSFLGKSEPITQEKLRKMCEEIVADPNFRPIQIPFVEKKITPTAITVRADVEYPEYIESHEDSHIPTEEKEYFKAVDEKDWVRVFKFEAGHPESLSKEEVIEYGKKIGKGDIQAKHALFSKRLWKVIDATNSYLYKGVQEVDLIQEGAIGLWKSVKKFDLNKGQNFHSFSNTNINRHLGRAVEDLGRTIRLPIHIHSRVKELTETFEAYVDETNHEIRLNVFADLLDSDSDKLIPILFISLPPIDIDYSLIETNPCFLDRQIEEIYSEEYHIDNFTFLVDVFDPFGIIFDRFSNILLRLRPNKVNSVDMNPLVTNNQETIGGTIFDTELDLENDTFLKIMQDEVNCLLEKLPKREAEILRMRFGMNSNYRTYTLEELGGKFNVTRERIRQIEKQALNRLADSSYASSLRLYLNA